MCGGKTNLGKPGRSIQSEPANLIRITEEEPRLRLLSWMGLPQAGAAIQEVLNQGREIREVTEIEELKIPVELK